MDDLNITHLNQEIDKVNSFAQMFNKIGLDILHKFQPNSEISKKFNFKTSKLVLISSSRLFSWSCGKLITYRNQSH